MKPPQNKSLSLKVYKIIYSNGIVQYKNLVAHSDWLSIVGPRETRHLANPKKIEKRLKEAFGEFFTTESPLYAAISTGILELNGYSYNIKMGLWK